MTENAKDLLQKLRRKYPNAAFYTPSMIAIVAEKTNRDVRHHCKRHFPQSGAHYRFYPDDGEKLNRILCILSHEK